MYFSQQFSEQQQVTRTKKTPTFSLLTKKDLKSQQLRVSVSFPDGHFDILAMKPFVHSVQTVSQDCHFSGHLTNEPNACVAMTGCIGSEDVELTILSENDSLSGMYIWKMDDSVVELESPWKVHKSLNSN